MKLTAGRLKWGLNLWPPLLGTGIVVKEMSDDFSFAKVEMKLRWYNRNFVGVHYGGSLFNMTDPFHMIMLMHRIGSNYYVWDSDAKIQFIAPGKGKLSAEFNVSDEIVALCKERTKDGDKYFQEFHCHIKDEEGKDVATVHKHVYVKLKKRTNI